MLNQIKLIQRMFGARYHAVLRGYLSQCKVRGITTQSSEDIRDKELRFYLESRFRRQSI